MKVLFYIEPVAFQGRMGTLKPHLYWVYWLAMNNSATYAVASSGFLNSILVRDFSRASIRYLNINQWDFLAPFGFDKAAYVRALYRKSLLNDAGEIDASCEPIVRKLEELKRAFSPDVVVCTTQNAVVKHVFRDRLCLFMEQSPMPRLARIHNMFLDPFGHQTGTAFHLLGDDILDSEMADAEVEDTVAAWERFSVLPEAIEQRRARLRREMETLRRGRKVALFAMQPPDYPSYEGAYEPLPPEAVVARWAEELPPDWVGIPIFHKVARFPQEFEKPLASRFTNLAFLPPDLASDVADIAIDHADALVTISSNAAMNAGLKGKVGIVLGRSAFSHLIGGNIADLATRKPLDRPARARIMRFLANRYCHGRKDIFQTQGYFRDVVRRYMVANDIRGYLLDNSQWSAASIARYVETGDT